MEYPFLKEGRVQYCHAAPARKLILDGPGVSGAGRYASPDYSRCELVEQGGLTRERCPHLEEVHGVEWPMTFPNPLLIQKVNGYLRSDPKRTIADPFGSGWLFAGWELPERTRAGLIGGHQAAARQAEEQELLAQEIHETLKLSCDGGNPVRRVGQLLSRQQLVCLLQHFFPNTHWGAKE